MTLQDEIAGLMALSPKKKKPFYRFVAPCLSCVVGGFILVAFGILVSTFD